MSRVPSGEGALPCAFGGISGGISPAPGTARSPLPGGGLSPPGAPSGPPRLRSVLVPARRRLPAPSHPALLRVAQGRGSPLALGRWMSSSPPAACGAVRAGTGRAGPCAGLRVKTRVVPAAAEPLWPPGDSRIPPRRSCYRRGAGSCRSRGSCSAGCVRGPVRGGELRVPPRTLSDLLAALSYQPPPCLLRSAGWILGSPAALAAPGP